MAPPIRSWRGSNARMHDIIYGIIYQKYSNTTPQGFIDLTPNIVISMHVLAVIIKPSAMQHKYVPV